MDLMDSLVWIRRSGRAGVDLPWRIRRSRSTGVEWIYWSGFASGDLLEWIYERIRWCGSAEMDWIGFA